MLTGPPKSNSWEKEKLQTGEGKGRFCLWIWGWLQGWRPGGLRRAAEKDHEHQGEQGHGKAPRRRWEPAPGSDQRLPRLTGCALRAWLPAGNELWVLCEVSLFLNPKQLLSDSSGLGTETPSTVFSPLHRAMKFYLCSGIGGEGAEQLACSQQKSNVQIGC